jgi:hypothetical protein
MKLHEIVDNEPIIYPLLKQLMAKGTHVFMRTWGSQENIITGVKLVQVDNLYGDGKQPQLELEMKHVSEDDKWMTTTTGFRVPEMSDQLELKKVDGNWRVIYPDFEPLDDHETK